MKIKFSKTKVDGASTFIEEDKPLIVMTLRYDRIDNFFFTLLHEVGHVVLGHAGINAACFDDLNNIDVTDQKEKEANDFAQKMLRTNDVSNVNPDVVNRRFIVQSADSKNVHPGIIVGAMQHDKVLDYWNYREYLVKIKNLVEDKFFLQAV